MGFDFEKHRIVVTRILALSGLALLCCSGSYWEEASPAVSSLLFFIGITLAVLGSFGRMWSSLYIAGYKDDKLIMEGPYSLCRNPLYFFSFIGALGVGFATETVAIPLVLALFFALYYPFVINGEEKRLRRVFGHQFEEYTKRVPAFFPRFKTCYEPTTYIVNSRVYKKHCRSALWFVLAIGLLEVIEGVHGAGLLPYFLVLY